MTHPASSTKRYSTSSPTSFPTEWVILYEEEDRNPFGTTDIVVASEGVTRRR